MKKLIIDSKFNLDIINIECKRREYLENIVNSLKNTINNLANP